MCSGQYGKIFFSYESQRNSFANWIAGVARIKALDYKRRYAGRLREVSWDAAELAGKGEAADWETEKAFLLEEIEREFSEETQQMLDCIKPVDRELFLKLYVEEQSMQEGESGN